MKHLAKVAMAVVALALVAGPASAATDAETIAVFQKAGESAEYFKNSYGYAVFPTIGKVGLGIGGAHGDGRVYERGKYVGDTSMSQLSLGFQAGGQGFSEIIFFEDKGPSTNSRPGTLMPPRSGCDHRECFGQRGTQVQPAGQQKEPTDSRGYYKGMVFSDARGLMYEANCRRSSSTAGSRSSHQWARFGLIPTRTSRSVGNSFINGSAMAMVPTPPMMTGTAPSHAALTPPRTHPAGSKR
jgi:hypothetical protein